jgi:hypothetical protein
MAWCSSMANPSTTATRCKGCGRWYPLGAAETSKDLCFFCYPSGKEKKRDPDPASPDEPTSVGGQGD